METKTVTNNLGFFLEHVSSLFAKQLDQVLLEQLGIGYAQFKVLRVLMDHGTVGQHHIAKELGQTEASISRQMRLLQDDGFVRSETDPHNRRQRLSLLTHKGRRFVLAADQLLEQFEQTIFEPFKRKELHTLQQTLDRIHDHAHNRTAHIPTDYVDFLESL